MIYNLPLPATPALIDVAINEINENLKAGLPWLKNAFGKCQRISKQNELKKTVYFPAIHYGQDREHLDLTPNDEKENYSFWEIEDPYTVETIPNQYHIINAKYSIVFWFNINTILDVNEGRNLELLKSQILDVFTENNTRASRVIVTEIAERFENLFRGYSYKEVDEQFIMHPYAGLKISGTLRYEKQC